MFTSVQLPFGVAVARALMSVPFHGCTGLLMGVSLARRVMQRPNEAPIGFWQTMWLPIVSHGTFDFLLFVAAKPPLATSESRLLLAASFFFLVVMLILFIYTYTAFVSWQCLVACNRYERNLSSGESSDLKFNTDEEADTHDASGSATIKCMDV